MLSIVAIMYTPPMNKLFWRIVRSIISITDNSSADTCPNSSMANTSNFCKNINCFGARNNEQTAFSAIIVVLLNLSVGIQNIFDKCNPPNSLLLSDIMDERCTFKPIDVAYIISSCSNVVFPTPGPPQMIIFLLYNEVARSIIFRHLDP